MVDESKVKEAVKLLLEGIGEDPEREGLKDTPDRIARMYTELMAGYEDHPSNHLSRTFAAENNEIVLEKDIVFYSMCEHHMMPFFGKAHIAYIPNGKVVGLSKHGGIKSAGCYDSCRSSASLHDRQGCEKARK